MIRAAAWTSAALAVGALAWGYLQAGLWPAALGVVAFAVAWGVGLACRRAWAAAAGLLAGALAAAAGVALQAPAGWMAAGAVGALLAYDLFPFESRLRRAAPADDTSVLARRHLAWLALDVSVGVGLLAAAWHVSLRLSLGGAALLALVAALGVSRLVSRLGRG